MAFLRLLLLLFFVYWIIKAFQRIIAPFFQGYYGPKETKGKPGQERVNNIIIDTSKTRNPLGHKPDITKIDAEDVDFEEIK
jgi:hypothetical protein